MLADGQQMRLLFTLVGAVACLALMPAAASAASYVSTSPPAVGESAQLSNERTLTLSAHVAQARTIHASPDSTSRSLGRLRYWTEDRFAEVYLVLRAYTDQNGREWTKIRIPGRPNGRVGWVVRDALGPFRATRQWLVVNRRSLTITLYVNGKRRFRRPVGIGARRTPTPAGRFWIRERIKVRDKQSPYWPYALGTANYSRLSEWPGGGVVGIHGDWEQPWLIPGRPSHGCIRMRNRDIAWLAPRVDMGAPLRVI